MGWFSDNWGKIAGIAGGIVGLSPFGGTASAALGGLYDMFTNERNRGDYLKQQSFANDFAQRQQDFAEHTTTNAAQIRRRDLEASGLHPTLAAGGAASTSQAHMPSIGAHRNSSSGIQMAATIAQLRQLGAQTDMTSAEASRIRAETKRINSETEHIPKRWTLDYIKYDTDKHIREARNKIDLFRAEIAQQTENRLMSFRDIEQELIGAKISETSHRAVMAALQQRYAAEHKSLMPVRDIMNHEFEKALKHLGLSDSDAVLTVLRVLRHLLGR